MHQVLFRIPIPGVPGGVPIFGYGAMLFLAFVACTWLSGRLAEKQGIARQYIQDLALWLFVGGLLGARVTYLIEFPPPSAWDFLKQLPRLWDGGIILYGAVIGGFLAFLAAYFLILRKHHIAVLKMADIVAPSIALGICLGRVGCFLNGCCYGDVACEAPAVHFPLSSPARVVLTERGLQTAAGFTLTDRDDSATVAAVEPGSAADRAGLRAGDRITAVDLRPEGGLREVKSYADLRNALVREWPRGKTALVLTVVHKGETAPVTLPPFEPETLGLHPTQLYESVSMGLLFFLLMAYFPFRKHDGEVTALLMVCYAVHRSLNELLRNDLRPVGFEQNISIFLLVAGVALAVWLWRQPVQYAKPA